MNFFNLGVLKYAYEYSFVLAFACVSITSRIIIEAIVDATCCWQYLWHIFEKWCSCYQPHRVGVGIIHDIWMYIIKTYALIRIESINMVYPLNSLLLKLHLSTHKKIWEPLSLLFSKYIVFTFQIKKKLNCPVAMVSRDGHSIALSIVHLHRVIYNCIASTRFVCICAAHCTILHSVR